MRDVCVVTGGAGGMGLAAAKLLGRDHSIVLCDVSRDGLDAAAKELEASGVECKTSVVDITDDQSVAELVSQAMGFGVVRSVVHAAGVSPSMGSAEFIVRINALGTLNVNEAFYPTVEDGFAIVNVASVAAHMFPRVMVPRRHFKHAQRDADVFMKKMTSACNIAPAAMRPGFAYSISKNFVSGTAPRRPPGSAVAVDESSRCRRAPSTPPWAGSRNEPARERSPSGPRCGASASQGRLPNCWRSAQATEPAISPASTSSATVAFWQP